MKIKLIVILVFALFINIALFAETEEDKYRVNNIHPVQGGGGIPTGHVIAYGHYIKPPYQVTMEVKDITINYDKDMNPIREKQYYVYINGVQVTPTLTLKELKTGRVIRGMEGVNVGKERIKRISGSTVEYLETKYYELVKESGKVSAIEEIKSELKNNKHVKSYSVDTNNETIKVDFGDGEIKCSFDEFARRGLFNKTRKIVSYLEDNFGKWEYELGKSKAEEMLYEYLKGNPLVEKYEAFYKSRWVKVKFKDEPVCEEFYLQGYRYYGSKVPVDQQKEGEIMADSYKESLSLGQVIIINIGGGQSGVRGNNLIKVVKILRRRDIDNSVKKEMLSKDLGMDNKTIKEILYNFDPMEYSNFGD